MKLNPNAVVFWACVSSIGFLVGGLNGAILGFAISSGISIILSVLKD